jgi:hypothetical protein
MSFEEQLQQALETLSERLRGDIEREVERRTAEAIAALPVAPVPEPAAVEVLTPPVQRDPTERLTDAFAAIDRARSLTEVLDAVEDAARADQPRAEIWLIRDGRPHRWRAAEPAREDDSVPSIDDGIPLAIGEQTVALVITNSERGTNTSALDTGSSQGDTTTDEGRAADDERRTRTLRLLARYASRTLEALTAFKTARAVTEHADKALEVRS